MTAEDNQRSVSTLSITSPAFVPGAPIPSQYTCDGADINPALTIDGVPKQTVSLTLIMDDPDAPAGVWDHWIVFNIAPDTHEIAEKQEPVGVHGRGTSGNMAYHGPCPPDREHRYFFKLYALDTQLDLPEGSTKAAVEAAMRGHILDQVELVGRYARS
jgi:Raf kinase inhibitor-like YbhB/YbcL family protein